MKIMLIADDPILSDVICFYLQREGYRAVTAQDGLPALDRLRIESPDLIMLDLNFPVADAMVLCKGIRDQSDTPLIVLSGSAEENDVVEGLELGADDYIIKPFSPRLMMARIKALLRRSGSLEAGASTLTAGDLMLDCTRRELRREDQLITALTRQETRLLEILIRNNGHVLPAETLMNHVWGAARGDRLMLKKLVSRLRHKLACDPLRTARIETISGVGYRLVTLLPVCEKRMS